MLKLMRAPHKYVQGENALNEFYDIVKDMGKVVPVHLLEERRKGMSPQD